MLQEKRLHWHTLPRFRRNLLALQCSASLSKRNVERFLIVHRVNRQFCTTIVVVSGALPHNVNRAGSVAARTAVVT